MLPQHATLSAQWCAVAPGLLPSTKAEGWNSGPAMPTCLLSGVGTSLAHVPAPLCSGLAPKARASLSERPGLGAPPSPPHTLLAIPPTRTGPGFVPDPARPARCMQTSGFHILAYQGQTQKHRDSFWADVCVTEEWTHVNYVSAQAFAHWLISVTMVAFSLTTRGIQGHDHFQGVRAIPRGADARRPPWQPGILFKDDGTAFQFLSFVMAKSTWNFLSP